MSERLFHTEVSPEGVTEKWYSDAGGNIRRVTTQNTQSVMDGVKAVADQGARGKNQYYLGSIPLTVASQWAKTCGAAVGTREFADYAKKQLLSGDYSKLASGLS